MSRTVTSTTVAVNGTTTVTCATTAVTGTGITVTSVGITVTRATVTGAGSRPVTWNRAGPRGASGLRQGRSPAGRSSCSPGILAVRSTLRTQR